MPQPRFTGVYRRTSLLGNYIPQMTYISSDKLINGAHINQLNIQRIQSCIVGVKAYFARVSRLVVEIRRNVARKTRMTDFQTNMQKACSIVRRVVSTIR